MTRDSAGMDSVTACRRTRRRTVHRTADAALRGPAPRARRRRYTDDISMPGQAYAVFVRSPHAHASIVAIDTAAARAHAGRARGADRRRLCRRRSSRMAHSQSGRRHRHQVPTFVPSRSGKFSTSRNFRSRPSRVRYLGEAVAVVVADSLVAARDAAEAVVVEYEVLPAVTDVAKRWRTTRRRSGRRRPTISRSTRSSATAPRSRPPSRGADLVVEQTFRNQRIASARWSRARASAATTRPRSVHADFRKPGRPSRPPWCWRKASGAAGDACGVICPDVGGGFGLRNNLYPEQVAILWAASRVGRPVKWTNDRSEAFLTDYTARDLVTTARLALDRDGRICALDLDLTRHSAGRP